MNSHHIKNLKIYSKKKKYYLKIFKIQIKEKKTFF